MAMKYLILAAVLVGASPAVAQEQEGGKSLMQQGAELFLKGLTEQMEPALEEFMALAEDMGPQLMEFFAEMGPALSDLLEEVEDWSAYEAPEILPNGDIIIRRKPEAQQDDPAEGTTEI